MADYMVLNNQSIYTKEGVDKAVKRATDAVANEVTARQTAVAQVTSDLTQEIENRQNADESFDDRITALESVLGDGKIIDEDGNEVSLQDFYREFLKERVDRQTEDTNIEEEFEEYLKSHSSGGSAALADYSILDNKPWVKYKDANDDVQFQELKGGADKALDLTAISGGKKNFNELEKAFTINGLASQSANKDEVKDIRLEATVHKFNDDGTYDTEGKKVPVNELDLSAFTIEEIRELFE